MVPAITGVDPDADPQLATESLSDKTVNQKCQMRSMTRD
jgi:hypothetical protein